VVESPSSEIDSQAHRDGLRQQMLSATRNLIVVSSFALVAIAVTIAVAYTSNEQTTSAVAESRELSRLARTAHSASIEMELAPADAKAGREDDARQTAVSASGRLESMVDSLTMNAARGGRRDDIIELIAASYAKLKTASSKPDANTANRFERELREATLRDQLLRLVHREDRRYEDRQTRQEYLGGAMTAVVFAEILVLLLVVNRLRKRLYLQASEVVAQQESIEHQRNALQKQAEALETTNNELALAIQEKEYARKFAEDQATEQATLFSAITEVFFVLDREGRYHKIAAGNDQLLAASRKELLGKQVTEVLPPPVAALALASISRALDTRSRVDVEYPLDLQGRTVWFAGTVTPIDDEKILWVVRDVSETKQAAEALKESEARFRYLVEHSPQAVVLHAEGLIHYANQACASLLGFTSTEVIIGAPLFRFVTDETRRRLIDSLASLGRNVGRAPTCESQFRRINDGRLLDIEVTSVPLVYNGRAGVLSILHDVTERKQLEKQLAHQAFHDPLTNLANRVLFRDRVEHSLQRAARGSGTPSVLFIDLDNFKAVNDGLGHSAGDWLLIEVATRLQSTLRPADTVARLGGDEFAVLLDDEAGNAEFVADRILQAFQEPFNVQGTDIVVTMSIGIASLLPHQGADEVLRNADLALYRAKAEGKACAASFEPEMHVAALRRLEMENELRRAIYGEPGAGALELYYQPIARLSTGRMFGFEALVRWKHPERGILEPLDFISLAEETGLIVPLGRWVLEEACRQAREWQQKFGPLLRGSGMGMIVGVNLSGRHLAQPEIVNDVATVIRRTNITPSHLVLEMTESMLVHDNRATLERLHALKSLGVRLSIDDFGTGYSSLAYLERFPVDSLKMDRSFITGLDGQSAKSPLAEAVIGLGRILGLRVVAEGIETREQWERLRMLGCGLGQGFHISHPLPAREFEQLIATSAAEAKGLIDGRFPMGLSGARRTPVTGLAATA
jgi:diguanylate cyclase (GGDEF)-like protein/PAS domain S-box-containing protein